MSAPPYGSSADGELWVSTLKTKTRSSSTRTTPALSVKTLTSQCMPAASRSFWMRSVDPRMKVLKSESTVRVSPVSRST